MKSLTGAARDSYYKNQFEQKDGEPEFQVTDCSARLLALSLCDENGDLWFSDSDEGVSILREKSSGALQVAFEAALKLNGLTAEETEAAKENLETIQSEGSG